MPLEIIRNDITKVHADAIVNAANSALQQGGGVCGAIFAAAGAEKLQKECDAISSCKAGEAVITKAYDLPARYIIHTVGPVWHGGTCGEEKQLADCYKNSLALAKKHELESVAFPLISSGIYHYPKDKALQVAISAIGEFLLKNDMIVYLVVFDKAAFVLSEKISSSIKQYIDENYIDENISHFKRDSYICEENLVPEKTMHLLSPQILEKSKRNLSDIVFQVEESFSQMLLRMIDQKGMSDVAAYKKANIDRRLFSKIRSDINYQSSKHTAIAFAIALELNLDETKDLLLKAGFALSHCNKFDIIVEYFIKIDNYNIFEINEALFYFGQPMLGA